MKDDMGYLVELKIYIGLENISKFSKKIDK